MNYLDCYCLFGQEENEYCYLELQIRTTQGQSFLASSKLLPDPHMNIDTARLLNGRQ